MAPWFEPGNFLHRRLAQAQHDVAGADERLAVGGDRRAGFGVGLVGKSGGDAEAGLDLDLRAELDEFGALSGVSGARVSPGCVSFGTEIFMVSKLRSAV